MRLVLLWVGATLIAASAWAQAGFVGAERCKLCHREVYESWLRTPHASTGTVDIDADASCNACHTTDVGTRRRGVQCEACHGAGEDYWPAEVMIDPDKASMAGLVQPTPLVCRRCHDNEKVGPDHRRDVVIPPRAEWEAWVHVRDEP
jgi:hypothetical protein